MIDKLGSILTGLFSVEEKGGITSNVGYAFASQAISLIASFMMSLIVPKVLGVAEYAHWQLFLFYANYVAITMLGVGDGVYLRLGGKRFSEIDGGLFKTEALAVCLSQVLVATVVWAISNVIELDEGLRFVFGSLLVYGVIQNFYGVIAPVFQAVNLTRIYSISSVVNRLVFLALILLFIFSGGTQYEPLVAAYIIGSLCSLVYCVVCARDMLSARLTPLSSVAKNLAEDIRNGFKVMIAFYASSLVVGAARQVVVMRWGLETFGQMSFAFSMVSFALLFIAQLSLVLFPVLRRLDVDHLSTFYSKIRDLLFVISPLAYLLYLPVSFVLGIWLPAYSESFRYLGILMPLLVFDGKMNMLCSTYFKVYNDINHLLFFNFMALVVSLLLSCLGAYVIGSIEFVVCGLLAAIMLRSIFSERYLAMKRLHLGYLRLSLFECLTAVGFVASIYIGGLAPFFVPLSLYTVSLLLNRGTLESTLKMISSRSR